MDASPYRNTERATDEHASTESRSDRELLPFLALFWIMSVARVVAAFVRHETFGAEATLAFLAVLLLPLLAKESFTAVRRARG